MTLQDIVEAAPDVLLDLALRILQREQARDEYRAMEFPDQWNVMPAVRNNRVFALEANSYFSRPGPRLVTGIETLAKVLHPSLRVSAEAESCDFADRSGDRATARAALADSLTSA